MQQPTSAAAAMVKEVTNLPSTPAAALPAQDLVTSPKANNQARIVAAISFTGPGSLLRFSLLFAVWYAFNAGCKKSSSLQAKTYFMI